MKRDFRQFATLFLMLWLAACASDKTILTPASYADLPDWASDDHAVPLKLFADSCVANQSRATAYATKSGEAIGDKSLWQNACAQAIAATATPAANDAEARAFFENNFAPYHVTSEQHRQALITGYYEPVLNGALQRGGPFQTPVYGVPNDLTLRQPYFTRAEIEAGAMGDAAPILLYVDDPVMLFFLQVQGSGKVRLLDGSLVGLQYAAQNGQPYIAIGKVLKDMNALDTVTMQTIRDWLRQHPDQAATIMNQNPSYVFFKLASGTDYAKGALGLPLTPLRSIAIDDACAAYGVPTYIATTEHDVTTGAPVPLRRLFVSQDTGGALHGPHRADIFFGRGGLEEWQAGLENETGDVYWLLPTAPTPGIQHPMPSAAVSAPAMPPLPSNPAADAPLSPLPVPTPAP